MNQPLGSGSVAGQATFPQFRRLPAELRIKVWEFCLPCRVLGLDTPSSEATGDPLTGKISNCTLASTIGMIYSPPLIAQVCYESRAVALENGFKMYQYVDFEGATEALRDSQWPDLANAWVQPGRDILHLHWKCSSDRVEVSPTPLLKFTFLVEKAQLRDFASSPPSIMTSLIFDGGYFHDDRSRRNYPRCTLEALGHLPAYQVIITTIPIHIPLKVARQCGHFGLLGDAPIQLVDPLDLKTVVAFHNLLKGREERKSMPEDPAWSAFREIIEIDGPSDASEHAKSDSPGKHKLVYKLTERFRRKVEEWKHFLEHRYIDWRLFVLLINENSLYRWGPSVFLPQPQQSETDWDPLSGLVRLLQQLGSPEFPRVDRFNRDHPLVKEVVATMPDFRPTIMFRLCTHDCC